MSDGMTDSSRGHHMARAKDVPPPEGWYVKEYDGHPDFLDHVSVQKEGHCSFSVSSWSEGERLAGMLNRPLLEEATKEQLQKTLMRLESDEVLEDLRQKEEQRNEVAAARAVLRKYKAKP